MIYCRDDDHVSEYVAEPLGAMLLIAPHSSLSERRQYVQNCGLLYVHTPNEDLQIREANSSVQTAALRIWEGENHTSGTWGGVVGSMENLVKRRGQSARLFFQMTLVFIKKDISGKSVYSGIKAYP